MAKETAKKASAGKKTTAKKKAAPAKKTAAKKKPAAKRMTASPKKKAAPKAKSTASRTSKTSAKKPARKPKASIKDLLAKKFEKMASPPVVRVEAPSSAASVSAAHISMGSREDAAGLRTLLLKKINYQDFVSAAQKAAAEKAAAEKAAAEKAAAEKAAAEKAAAEKAAAEKAAAEKAAAEKAAAEKAAAEKAAAEKAAAEKATAEKAAAEKAAAEKAAAEKAAAEKAAAEKATAEKAAAEKAAAEKAAAEKAAAEKAAAEKAAAEKAAAEKAAAEKAAAEKAAAEKAAAEKAAAEKAAAEKAAAEKAAKVTLAYGSDDAKGNDTMDKTVKILVGAVLAVILLLVVASFSNTGHYYLKKTDRALQVWQGNFAPQGAHLLISLPGMAAPDVVKSVYTQKDVFPLVFNYYIDKSDALLTKKGMPDFGTIKADLDKASKFAVTPASKAALNARTNTLGLLVLLYKAEAFAAKKQPADLEKALKFLDQAEALATSNAQKALIAEKRAAAKKALEKPAPPKTAKPEMVRRPTTPQVKAKPPAPPAAPHAAAESAPPKHE